MLKIWPVIMFLRVCAIYQLLLPNLIWLYMGDNMGQSWQQLMAHSLWTDHSDKALHEQKSGERSWGDESGSSSAAALQGHSRQLQKRQRETKWQDIRYTDSDEEGQILIHLGQKQCQVLKQRATVMFRAKCWTTQLHTRANPIPPLQGITHPLGWYRGSMQGWPAEPSFTSTIL